MRLAPHAHASTHITSWHSVFPHPQITLTAVPASDPTSAGVTALLKDVRSGSTGVNLEGTAFADSGEKLGSAGCVGWQCVGCEAPCGLLTLPSTWRVQP